MGAIPLQRDIDYPESTAALEDRYLEALTLPWRAIFLYYVQGNPRAVVCPDVSVVRRAQEEAQNLQALCHRGDLARHPRGGSRHKKGCYEQLGVEEYFHPWQEHLVPPLQGYRLIDGQYYPFVPARHGSLISLVTRLALRPEGERLRLFTIEKPLLRIDELWDRLDTLEASREADTRAAAQEAQARREAEARAAQAEARAA